MSDSATELTMQDTARNNARRYLADKAYLCVLGKSQTAKLRQILKAVDVEGITMRLMRDVMAGNDRFTCVDRRWAPAVRFGDSHRPFEREVTDILQTAGVALSLDILAQECAHIYGRPAEYYEEALRRILADKEKYFQAIDGKYGVASWLLIPTSEDEADIIFDNFMSEEQVAEYTDLCPALEWDPDNMANSATTVVENCKQPVPLKVLALFAWRSIGDDFDPVDFYSTVIDDEHIIVMSDQKAYPAKMTAEFAATLKQMADELAELPMEPEEEEAEGPITVTDTDKEEIVAMIFDRGSASTEEMLEQVLEVTPEDTAYAGAYESLKTALEGDERIMWLGGTRYGKVEKFPDEVLEIPASLVVPAVPVYETPEGDVYDQELEEDGFEGNIKAAIYEPLAEDVTDEDPSRTMYQPNGDSQRCVLKYHHKIAGTFPLCQVNPDFFGTQPEIIPITLIEEGKRKTAYVNNNTRLIYGLKDFFKNITEVSGAAFYIEKTANSGEFRYRFDDEIDDQLGVDLNRSLELLDLKSRYESQDMPVFDVVVEILDQHKKGMSFAQLVNEVNIVRRCSRLLVASILSSYHCFHTRGKSDLWQYDEKKRSQGFNKTKRKYVKK